MLHLCRFQCNSDTFHNKFSHSDLHIKVYAVRGKLFLSDPFTFMAACNLNISLQMKNSDLLDGSGVPCLCTTTKGKIIIFKKILISQDSYLNFCRTPRPFIGLQDPILDLHLQCNSLTTIAWCKQDFENEIQRHSRIIQDIFCHFSEHPGGKIQGHFQDSFSKKSRSYKDISHVI